MKFFAMTCCLGLRAWPVLGLASQYLKAHLIKGQEGALWSRGKPCLIQPVNILFSFINVLF